MGIIEVEEGNSLKALEYFKECVDLNEILAQVIGLLIIMAIN